MSEPLHSTFAITCDDCGVMMPIGTLVLYNPMQEYVHVVCPNSPGMDMLRGVWQHICLFAPEMINFVMLQDNTALVQLNDGTKWTLTLTEGIEL